MPSHQEIPSEEQPEACLVISNLVNTIRIALTDWSYFKMETQYILYEARAQMLNTRMLWINFINL